MKIWEPSFSYSSTYESTGTVTDADTGDVP